VSANRNLVFALIIAVHFVVGHGHLSVNLVCAGFVSDPLLPEVR